VFCDSHTTAFDNTEQDFSDLRLVSATCVEPLRDLEAYSGACYLEIALDLVLIYIPGFAENENESGFLKRLFQKDARVFKIEAFWKRITSISIMVFDFQ
jgi:hypothetical protein